MSSPRDLNERNVVLLYRNSFSSAQDSVYSRMVNPVAIGTPRLWYNYGLYKEQYPILKHMMGQLYSSHYGGDILEFSDGYILYNEKLWTKDKIKLAYFYYLLSATVLISDPIINGTNVRYLRNAHNLKPTFLSSDPRQQATT